MYSKNKLRKAMHVIFFQCLLFGLLIICNSTTTTTTTYFGTRTTDGPNGVIYYSVKQINVGYNSELINGRLDTNNYILGVFGDNNLADVLFSSNVYLKDTTISVIITTMEYARDTQRLLCTFTTQGIAKFGYITFADTSNANRKVAYITELTMNKNSSTALPSLNVKIGVSNYFHDASTEKYGSAYIFASWDSLEHLDSLWLIQIAQNDDTFSLKKLDDLIPGVNEIAAISRHVARDIPPEITAIDIISREKNGLWGCATIQFGEYASYSPRPDVYFERSNETGAEFALLGSGNYQINELQTSLKINNGVGLFYRVNESATSLGKMSTLLKPRLSSNAFKEPESWGYEIEAKLVLPITNASLFNATLFKLAIIKCTAAKKLSDIKVNGVKEVTSAQPTRRLNVHTLRRLGETKNVTKLEVDFTLNLVKEAPAKTVSQVESLSNSNSDSAKSFLTVFPVLPTESAIQEVQQSIDVGELKVVKDKCISSKIGVMPEIPDKLFWPIYLDEQFSPATLDRTVDQAPMIYDVFDTSASIAFKLRTQSFDISMLVIEEQLGFTQYVADCKCNNECRQSKNIKAVTKAEIIKNGTRIDKSKIFTHSIICASIDPLKYGEHGKSIDGTITGSGCVAYLDELYLTKLKPSTTYHIFTVAHAGTQSTKPYITTFTTKKYAPPVQFSIPAVTSDGFSISVRYGNKLMHPTRILYFIVSRESLAYTKCETTTSRQMTNLIKNNVIKNLKVCHDSILYKGVDEIDESGHKLVTIVSKSLTDKGYDRFARAAKLVVFAVSEYNFSDVENTHGTYSPRFRSSFTLAHHNMSLSTNILPEDKSLAINVYAHFNMRPVPGELLNFTCFVTGYTTNVDVLHEATPSALENHKWNLEKHLIAKLVGVQDQNNSEVTFKSFAVTCRNKIMHKLHSKKLMRLTYHDEMVNTLAAESQNVVWPNWSDSYVIKTDQLGRYHFEDNIESLTTFGNQTFEFMQNDANWLGQMFTPNVTIQVSGINAQNLKVSQSGRVVKFLMPSYDKLCPTKQNCTRDSGYKELMIANPRSIVEPRILGARGGYYRFRTVYAYNRCAGTEKFSIDPDICWNKYKSSSNCAFGSGDRCVKCPANAICPGGTRAWPHSRHWNVDDYSDQVIRCSPPSAQRCVAHNRKRRSVICGPEYDNSTYVCEQCATNHYNLWNKCVKCADYYKKTSPIPSFLRGLGFVAASIFAMNIFVYLSIIGVGGSILSSMYLVKRFLLEFVFYLQLIAVATRPIYPLQTLYSTAVSYSLYAVMIDWDIFIPLSCFGKNNILFYSDKIYMAIVLVCLAVSIILATVKNARPERCCKRHATAHFVKNQVTPYIRYWILVVLGILYAKVSTSVFSFLACSKVDNGPVRLDRDITVICNEGEHLAMLPLVYITLVVYVIGFPIGSTYFLYYTLFGKHRRNYMERSELTVFEYWMNDEFQHWQHRERLWHFSVLGLLSFTSTFFTKVHMATSGLVIDLILLVIYFVAIVVYSPVYSKIRLKQRIRDAFLFDEAGTKKVGANDDDQTPRKFIGPLSKKIMANPVILANGKIYERALIGRWFAKGNVNDPISKRPLKSLELKPAIKLQKEIHLWKGEKQKKARKKKQKKSFTGSSGWKASDSADHKRVLEEVYERELVAMEDLVAKSLDEEEAQATKQRELKFNAHMVLKRSSTNLELKSIRLILTSETDPSFNLQEECGPDAFQMIREQYELVASFEEFPQLLASMLDRTVDQKETSKLVITPAPGDLEFAQLGIRNLTMKGQFSEVLVLNLMPSKYTPQFPWLFVGKLGCIVVAIAMVVASYLMVLKHEALGIEIEQSVLNNVELAVSTVFFSYVVLMLLIYQIVSHRFGTKMHVADENRQMLSGKNINTDDDDGGKETEEQMWIKSKEKSLRSKHKNLVLAKGLYDMKTISALGNLGLHLVEQPGKIHEGTQVLRDTIRGFTKAKVGPSNPLFLQYQKALLKYEKISLEMKKQDRRSITNVEGIVPDIIEVHAFENNKAQLWGSWFGSHKVYKSKHVCAVFTQRMRGVLILLDGASIILVSHFETEGAGWVLSKCIIMFLIQLACLIYIDHNNMFKFKKKRSTLLIIDLITSIFLFMLSVGSLLVLVLLIRTHITLLLILFQGIVILLLVLMFVAILFEMFENAWICLIQICRKRRQTVRKRRNTVRRQSIQLHFDTFGDEMKLEPSNAVKTGRGKARRKSKGEDNPLGIEGETPEQVGQEYLNPMHLEKVKNEQGEEMIGQMEVANPLLASKQRRRSSKSSEKPHLDDTEAAVKLARREKRRIRRESGLNVEDEVAKNARREKRRIRRESGLNVEDEVAKNARREKRRIRRESGLNIEDEVAKNARRVRREQQLGDGNDRRKRKKNKDMKHDEEKRARHEKKKIERQRLEDMGIKPPEGDELLRKKRKKKKTVRKKGSVAESLKKLRQESKHT